MMSFSQLENAGFSAGYSPSRFDRDQLLERFHEQLQLLHRDWQETGCKTIILIDGLDHIEREQHPGRSLLVDLPEPDQIPDGVYLVLGSQTDTPLSGRIKAEVRHQDRRVKMLSLGRQQVHEIIAAADIPILVTPEQKRPRLRPVQWSSTVPELSDQQDEVVRRRGTTRKRAPRKHAL